MEIFQTIWNVLTTENEVVTNIITAPLTFLEAYISMLLFTSILNIETTKTNNLIYVCLFSLIALFSIFIIPSPYNTWINVLICPVLVIIIYKTNFFKAILAEIIPYIFFVIFSALLQSFCLNILKLTTNELLYIPIYKIWCSSIIYFCVFFLYLVFLSKNINIKSFVNNKTLLINLIVGIVAITIEQLIISSYVSVMSVFSILLILSVLLIYFCINMYSLARTSNLETTTEKLQEEQLHNKTLTILYDNIRGFKHDFNNIIQGIGGYVATNNMEGLKEYYSQVLDDCQRVNNLTILTPEIINNPPIYSLLTTKYHKATELGIKVNLEIFMDLSVINMKIYELTRILGILLDNAIEASKTSHEKEINIIIRKDSRKNKQLFIIENTYSNKDVNIDKIFEKGHTSKTNEDSKNHGLGLWEVRQFVKKNFKTIDLYTTKDSKYFKQQFEIIC